MVHYAMEYEAAFKKEQEDVYTGRERLPWYIVKRKRQAVV